MKDFDAAFLDEKPLPTKFRPQNLRYAYRAIDSIRRVNFQSGMRSYMAEQNLRTTSAKSSRTNLMFQPSSASSSSWNDSFSGSSAPSSSPQSPQASLSSSSAQMVLMTNGTKTAMSSNLSNTAAAAVAQAVQGSAPPVSRAASSYDLLEQMRLRTHSNESLLKQKEILEKQLEELEHQLNRRLGNSENAGKEVQALKLEIEHVKSKIRCETKFLSLVVKALEGAVRKLSQTSLNVKQPDDADESKEMGKSYGDKSSLFTTSLPSNSYDSAPLTSPKVTTTGKLQ